MIKRMRLILRYNIADSDGRLAEQRYMSAVLNVPLPDNTLGLPEVVGGEWLLEEEG